MPDIDNRRHQTSMGYMDDPMGGGPDKSLTQQAIEQALLIGLDPQSAVKSGEMEEPQSRGLSKLSAGMLWGGAGADVGSTLYALSHGARESNPIYGSNPDALRLALIKGGSMALSHFLLNRFAKQGDGPNKTANLIAKLLGGAQGAIAAHNLTQAR